MKYTVPPISAPVDNPPAIHFKVLRRSFYLLRFCVPRNGVVEKPSVRLYLCETRTMSSIHCLVTSARWSSSATLTRPCSCFAAAYCCDLAPASPLLIVATLLLLRRCLLLRPALCLLLFGCLAKYTNNHYDEYVDWCHSIVLLQRNTRGKPRQLPQRQSNHSPAPRMRASCSIVEAAGAMSKPPLVVLVYLAALEAQISTQRMTGAGSVSSTPSSACLCLSNPPNA